MPGDAFIYLCVKSDALHIAIAGLMDKESLNRWSGYLTSEMRFVLLHHDPCVPAVDHMRYVP